MYTFDFNTPWGTEKDCYFKLGTYPNMNMAIQIFNEEGCIATCTINPDVHIQAPLVAIKNYSENEGMDKELIRLGLIKDKVVKTVPCGFIDVPIYELTTWGFDVLLNSRFPQWSVKEKPKKFFD